MERLGNKIAGMGCWAWGWQGWNLEIVVYGLASKREGARVLIWLCLRVAYWEH